MLKRIIYLTIVLTYSAFAQYERPGSTTAQFLKIDVSPRGAGMAGAYIAVVEGAEGVYYNPAIIADVEGTDVALSHNVWFAGISHEFMSVAHRFGRYGSFALSVTGLYTDEMKVRTPLQPDGTGETFYAGNYRIGLTYARKLTNRVNFGGTVNYINLSLYQGFYQEAFTIDISADYKAGYRKWRFGLAILNFGQSVTFVNEEYPMPTLFTFGMSINALEFSSYKLKVSGSGIKPNDGPPLGQVGTELNFKDAFFLRGGYNIGHEVARYAFGTGMKLHFGTGYNLRVDYAYNDFSALGAAHRFGVGFSF